jgi:hypothetical protein
MAAQGIRLASDTDVAELVRQVAAARKIADSAMAALRSLRLDTAAERQPQVVAVEVEAIDADKLQTRRVTYTSDVSPGLPVMHDPRMDVAKPWTLQRSRYDGQTIDYPDTGGQSITYTYTADNRRTANDGTNSEAQVITPAYHVGEILLALYVPTGVLGLAGNDLPLHWMDANTAGRQWARESAT